MTIAKQLALVLVKEVIANKRNSHIAPDYALRNEVNLLLGQALDSLVADGSLVQREASVNRYIAYEDTRNAEQTCSISCAVKGLRLTPNNVSSSFPTAKSLGNTCRPSGFAVSFTSIFNSLSHEHRYS